jgi:hypothetical protein
MEKGKLHAPHRMPRLPAVSGDISSAELAVQARVFI